MAISDAAIASYAIAGSSQAPASVIAETTSATDTVSSLASFASSLAETTSATDAPASTGTFFVSVAETTSAVDTVNIGGSTFDVTVTEAASALDALIATGPFHLEVAESAPASDTFDPLQKRRSWFLSFADVVPAPSGEGPGNPGKLFGDFALTQIYPNPNPRLR